ncbi:MAG: RNA polymerase sigma factor [Lachnospiraceae bacterium]|nr:RNA polymerase sigma factor [Lachnospiraceae bacterium]
MQDNQIVDLYWQRNEQAISETQVKYGAYLKKISYNILFNEEDSMECVNDTYLKAWNSMPPHRPAMLSTFLGKLNRNLAINKYNSNHAEKRGGGEFDLSLEELDECIPAKQRDDEPSMEELTRAINSFLHEEKKEARIVFVKRYFYAESVADIAKILKISESKVKSMLFRTRNRLKDYLVKEGLM